MKLPITIKFNNGEEATYVVNPPDWAKWELKTGKTIRQNDEIGMNDLMFLAYTSMGRTSGATFTFNILPDFPTAGGAGNEAQTVSFNFTVVGTPAESFS